MYGQQSNYSAFLPQAKVLQKHITHYYFHTRTSKGLPLEFSYYPHINHAVTAYCGSITQSTATQTLVQAEENSFTALYSRLQEQAHHVQIHGTFYKLGIVFKPYGINHFINRDLKFVSPDTISVFCDWGEEFRMLCENIWTLESSEKRIQLLESFLVEKISDNINPTFNRILKQVLLDESFQHVNTIATSFNMDRKTVYRLFKKELGCSPSQYFRILKFRKTLDLYLKSNELNLTQAAVAHHYDQSDFIKNVKAKTQKTPRQLFKSLTDLDGQTYWSFE